MLEKPGPERKRFPVLQKIRVKASLYVLVLLISTTLAFSIIALRIMNQYILSEVIKRVETLSRGTAAVAGYSLMSNDLLGLDNIVYRVKATNPDIESMAIINPEGEILVHSDTRRAGETHRPAAGDVLRKAEDGTTVSEVQGPARELYEIQTPIVFLDKAVGSVIMTFNKAVVNEAQQAARSRILGVFGLLLLVGVASSVFLTAFLTKPVQELSKGVADLKEGRRSRPLRVYSQDELGRLTESFNEMTALITSQKNSLSRYAQDLEEAYVSTVRVLAAAIDARDTHTLGHSTRVAGLSVELGRELDLSAPELEDLEIACLFHDVGKIKIPDSILQKKGRLTTAEQREMRRHPEYGAEILAKAPSLLKYIPAVKYHHEWFDGTGYPDGLSGGKIPKAAAIISLADVYDAMTSDRPYRDALSEEEARAEIAALAGRQFEPDLAARFILLLQKRAAALIKGHGE
ncbi:MAG: HD-GYP domain-containing protein [Candidatus Aminicenantes bacterium]|nr:HD-GYP domain-containing protein [Candidatus Aminicenantes bacterium]